MFYAFIWKPDTEIQRKIKKIHKHILRINLYELSCFYALK